MVFLNQTAVYALRAVAVLAALQPGESIAGHELSRRTDIPRQYLAKVMRRLVLAGLVRSQRGQGGGFALRRAPGDIPIGSVLEAVDCGVEADRCVFRLGSCDPQHPCVLHPIWSRLNQGATAWAADTTLADLGPGGIAPHGRRSRR